MMESELKKSHKKLLQLEKKIHCKPYRFGFYHTLRCLENAHLNKPKIGESLRPSDDILRLSQSLSMSFSSSTLSSFNVSSDNKFASLEVNFFGLFGPNGPLPLHLTEYAHDRLHHANDPTFSAFIDMFHHRLLSLFYRSWANSQPTVHFDRPETDRFRVYMGSLFGLGMPSLQNRDAMPDFAKLYFAGRLSSGTKNVEGLVSIIKYFFDVQASIKEFVGEWMPIPENTQFKLGEMAEASLLGENTILGDAVWQCQQKFKINIGPLNLTEYEKFSQGGERHKQLCAIIRNYVGDAFNWDITLILKRQDIPSMVLGENDYLGWNTWLGLSDTEDDAADMQLSPL